MRCPLELGARRERGRVGWCPAGREADGATTGPRLGEEKGN